MAQMLCGECEQARPQRNSNPTANRHAHAGHLRAIPLRSFVQDRAIPPPAELHLGSGAVPHRSFKNSVHAAAYANAGCGCSINANEKCE